MTSAPKSQECISEPSEGWWLGPRQGVWEPKAAAGPLFPSHKPGRPAPLFPSRNDPAVTLVTAKRPSALGQDSFVLTGPFLGPCHSLADTGRLLAGPSRFFIVPGALPPIWVATHFRTPTQSSRAQPINSTPVSAGIEVLGASRGPGSPCHSQPSRPRVRARANREWVRARC